MPKLSEPVRSGAAKRCPFPACTLTRYSRLEAYRLQLARLVKFVTSCAPICEQRSEQTASAIAKPRVIRTRFTAMQRASEEENHDS
jgi:hypothetical protein